MHPFERGGQMKLGAASRHLVGGGLVGTGDCEKYWRVYCECRASVAAKGGQMKRLRQVERSKSLSE